MQTHDQRLALRKPRKEEVSIQVLLPCLDGSCPAQVMDSETIDVSATGLRILLSQALDAEAIFDICVELENNPKRFLLTGETRWCRHSEPLGGYEIGIQVQEGEGTDFAAWATLFDVPDSDRS